MIGRHPAHTVRAASTGCAVVIPAYNASQYLRESLLSVLRVPCITQLIVVDDGSTDDTWKILADMQAQTRWIQIVSQRNGGVSAARNAGFEHVTTPFVCFLDADDRLLPSGIDALLRVLHDIPNAAAAFGVVKYIDEDSKPLELSTGRKESEPVTVLKVLQGNFIDTTGAILFRSEFVDRAGCFDPDIHFAEDWEFYARISLYGPLVPCADAVVEYRQHGSSVMHRESLSLGIFETALGKVFSATGPFAARFSSPILKRLELRARAGIIRRLGQRDQGAAEHMIVLRQLALVVVQSRGDRFVTSLLFRAFLTVGKRIAISLRVTNRH